MGPWHGPKPKALHRDLLRRIRHAWSIAATHTRRDASLIDARASRTTAPPRLQGGALGASGKSTHTWEGLQENRGLQENSTMYHLPCTIYPRLRGEPAGAAGEDLARDDKALDLRCALVYLVDLGVAHQFLDGVLRVEAVAAKHLHGIGDHLVAVVARERLRHRGIHRVAPALINLPRRLVHQPTRSFHTDGHVGNHETDGLMLRDGGAHCLPLESIRDGLVHRPSREAHGTGSHGGPGVVEGAHCDREAFTDRAQHVLRGYHHVIKGDAACIGAPLPHVHLLPPDSNPRRVTIHDKPGECGSRLGGGIRLGEHEEPIGHTAIGNPHLLAVENPRVTLLHSRGAEPSNIRAGARLSHAVSRLQRRLTHAAEVLHLLLV
mmetsp:Transcript_61690/g.137455  ORF Transcript_61690/g.137455 Transcript_61690/m.137455 type:complete len:378 (+) Transcript_61690:365-1498(+)